MSKELWSVLTKNMNRCIYTGAFRNVERHHVFGGSNKALSEKYGYIAPLREDLHPNGVMAGKYAKMIDEELKRMCQEHYEEYHGTREDFIREFGRSYIV